MKFSLLPQSVGLSKLVLIFLFVVFVFLRKHFSREKTLLNMIK